MKKEIIGVLVCVLLISVGLTGTATILKNNKQHIKEITADKNLLSPGSLQADDNAITIPGCAFIPEYISSHINYQTHGYDLKIFASHDSDAFSFLCPIMLPVGADISEIAFWWKDGNTFYDSTLYLIRHHLVLGTRETMAFLRSQFDYNSLTMSNTYTINNATIDSSHTYYLDLSLYKDTEFHGLRIRYIPEEDFSENLILGN